MPADFLAKLLPCNAVSSILNYRYHWRDNAHLKHIILHIRVLKKLSNNFRLDLLFNKTLFYEIYKRKQKQFDGQCF